MTLQTTTLKRYLLFIYGRSLDTANCYLVKTVRSSLDVFVRNA